MRQPDSSRRTFLMHGAAAVAATGAALDLASVAHAAGSDTLKVGLVGCGGRGTGAAEQALTADKNVTLVAMADAFDDRLDESLSTLKGSPVAGQVDVAEGSPVRRVRRLQAGHRPGRRRPPDDPARTSGRSTWPTRSRRAMHTFVEKPVAIDAPGVRAVPEVVRGGEEEEPVARLGPLLALPQAPARDDEAGPRRGDRRDRRHRDDLQLQRRLGPPEDPRGGASRRWSTRCATGTTTTGSAATTSSSRPSTASTRWPGRWATSRPIAVLGRRRPAGPDRARSTATSTTTSRIVYEYPNDVRGYHQCRHWRGTPNAGQGLHPRRQGHLRRLRLARSPARRPGATAARTTNMYQTEHDELFASIRAGKPINNGLYAAAQHPAGDHGPRWPPTPARSSPGTRR